MDKRSSPEAVAKRAATLQARLGVSSAMQSKEVVEKSNATKLSRFGCTKVPGSGRKKMTKEEFVERACAIHGDRYDYSRVVMSGTAVKVEIICPDHGVFLQTPAKHLAGRGCPDKVCVLAKKTLTTRARFGTDNVMQSSEIIKKRELNKTCLRRNDVMMIRELRGRTGLNQPAFAEKYHLSLATLRGWEQGARNCPESISYMLSELVERDYPSLVEDDGPEAMFDEDGVQDTCDNYKSYHRDAFHAALVTQFGESDVFVDYRSEKYPFPCDFYVKSRDLYI